MDSLIPIHSPHPLPSNDVRRQPPCCRVDLSKRVYQTLSNHARNAAHQNVRCFSFAGEAFRKSGAEAFRKSSAEALRRAAAAGSAKPRFYSLFWRANCGRRPRQRDRSRGNPKGGAALFGQSLPTFCWPESRGPARPAKCPEGVSASKGKLEF